MIDYCPTVLSAQNLGAGLAPAVLSRLESLAHNSSLVPLNCPTQSSKPTPTHNFKFQTTRTILPSSHQRGSNVPHYVDDLR
ncbi:hypothetical protein RSAG8_01282, partial [Rhizoctonia solani AG-8 WAC10335]